MGNRNSTTTRVQPLFDIIKDNPREIDRLLSMMSGYRSTCVDYSGYKVSYGKCEKRLKPPKSLLVWQIENMEKLSQPKDFGVKKTSPSYLKRKKFFERDPRLIDEARTLIAQDNLPSRGWYVFEGYTVPDIFIETRSHLIVGEAKRTESELTTKTTWLGTRDQLVRHIDAVIDSSKEVLSFFLFSKQGFQDRFSQRMENYSNIEYLKCSLRHRDDDTIKKIANTFIGYSFWEDIGRLFSVQYPDMIYEE